MNKFNFYFFALFVSILGLLTSCGDDEEDGTTPDTTPTITLTGGSGSLTVKADSAFTITATISAAEKIETLVVRKDNADVYDATDAAKGEKEYSLTTDAFTEAEAGTVTYTIVVTDKDSQTATENVTVTVEANEGTEPIPGGEPTEISLSEEMTATLKNKDGEREATDANITYSSNGGTAEDGFNSNFATITGNLVEVDADAYASTTFDEVETLYNAGTEEASITIADGATDVYYITKADDGVSTTYAVIHFVKVVSSNKLDDADPNGYAEIKYKTAVKEVEVSTEG